MASRTLGSLPAMRRRIRRALVVRFRASCLLLGHLVTPVRVLFWVCLECPLASQRAVDVGPRHSGLLREAVGHDRHVPAVEEVEQPIVHAALPGPQLVDAVPQQICRRPAQLVPGLFEPLDDGCTLRKRDLIHRSQLFEPLDHGRPTIGVW
jgi:hypothetical protein